MKTWSHTLFILAMALLSFCSYSQVNSLELNPEKEAAFTPYMWARHGGIEGLADFKKEHPHQYLKELWYYSESFYIKRDYFESGVTMNAEMIDITRFESNRKEDEEVYLELPGYKDALVLIPGNQLIFRFDSK